MQSEVKRRIAEGRAVMMQKVEEQLEQVSEGASQMDDKKKRMPMANQRPQASFCLFFFLKKKTKFKNEQEKQQKIAEIKAVEELKRKEQEDLERVMEENKRKLEEAQKKAQEELARSNQERLKVGIYMFVCVCVCARARARERERERERAEVGRGFCK